MKKISALIIFLLASLFSLLFPPSISAAWTKYAGNPILEPGSSGSWDDRGVFAPSVIFQGSTYKMWYAGYGGPAATNPVGRIGYATSTNGLNWIKDPAPVLNPSGPWEIHLGQPYVFFDTNEGIYKMWFTSTGNKDNQDVWRIGYATSLDGTRWTKDSDFVLKETSGAWDARGPVAPSILKINDQYKMWFMAFNGGQWQIGYATSLDGKAWEKDAGNPIFPPSSSESPTVADPYVIQELNGYVMFYHANHPPSTMNMATSLDGINWARFSGNSLFSLGPDLFDNFQIAAPSVIKRDSNYKMWYSGFDGSHWRIGYASTEEIPTFTPTPTIAPASTPTPTATSIPTSAPTSTPIPAPTPTSIAGPRKVVFLPGLGSSWNADAILNCKTEGYTGNWVLAPFATNTYTPLLAALGKNGKPFYYDWRKDVRSQAPVLQNFINNLIGNGEKVNLVGHSLGGLVGRAYLEKQGANSGLEKLLTIGSPHQGAPQAYPGWSAGEIWEENLINRIAATIILKRCATRREEPRETLRRIVPSIQNLLPIFNYLRDNKTKQLKPVAQMNAKNNWLTLGFSFYGVEVGTLSGNGFSTLKVIKVNERNKKDAQLGNWVDGKPAGKEKTNDGDNSVLLSSAQLPGAKNRVINQNHSGLIASNEGINEILDFLGVAGARSMASQAVPAEPRSALVIIGYPSGFWVMDSTGKLTKDQEGMISINNPGKGHYRFGLIPKSEKTLFIVAQFLEDGRTLWKEYNLKNRLPKFGKINFDPENPQEDALRLGL